MKKEAVYLLDDIDMAVDINTVKLDEAMKDLMKQGSIVIFISRSATEVEVIKGNTHIDDNWDNKIVLLNESMKLAKKLGK